MKKLFGILFILVVVLTFNSTLQACSCGKLKSNPSEAYKKSSVVFIGLVTEGKYSKNENASAAFFQIKVEKVFAGNLEPVVEAFYSSTLCGFNFKEGERYLIYTRAEPKDQEKLNFFVSSRCSRTRLLEEANEDLEFLRNQQEQKSSDLDKVFYKSRLMNNSLEKIFDFSRNSFNLLR